MFAQFACAETPDKHTLTHNGIITSGTSHMRGLSRMCSHSRSLCLCCIILQQVLQYELMFTYIVVWKHLQSRADQSRTPNVLCPACQWKILPGNRRRLLPQCLSSPPPVKMLFFFQGNEAAYLLRKRNMFAMLFQDKHDKSHQRRQWCRDEPDNSRGNQRLLHSA